MRLTLFAIPALVAGIVAFSAPSGLSENVILRQNFDGFAADLVGTEGSEQDEGGAWKEFGKVETSPKATDQEFFAAPGSKAAGQSIRIIRDSSVTSDFWLIGSWAVLLETGKVRASFRVLRESTDSGFSVHMGTAEKILGENTIAVAVGSRETSREKLGVMKDDGTWQYTNVQILTGTWTQVVIEIDFAASTYTVSVDGEVAAGDISFKWTGALRRISFLPTTPDANVSFIDDVEVVEHD